jgi:hypothetical protein
LLGGLGTRRRGTGSLARRSIHRLNLLNRTFRTLALTRRGVVPIVHPRIASAAWLHRPGRVVRIASKWGEPHLNEKVFASRVEVRPGAMEIRDDGQKIF